MSAVTLCEWCRTPIANRSEHVEIRLRFRNLGRFEGRRWLDYHNACWWEMSEGRVLRPDHSCPPSPRNCRINASAETKEKENGK